MKIHPDQLLAELKAATGKRAHKNLDLVHEVCREIFHSTADGKDYSLAAIGRETEKRGGPALNTLYAPFGKRFKALINCWAEWDGTRPRKPARPPSSATDEHDEVLRAIKDPVVSSLVAFRFAEARRWKAELDTIKANTELVIDQRPRDGQAMASDRVSRMFGVGAVLLPTEREALETVASDAWLHRNGFVEGADGEVLTRTGSLILPIGFLAAVRKTVGIARPETVDAVASPVESGTRL